MPGFLNPNDVLKNLEFEEEMLAAEFGSGSGFFAILLAKILEKGRVFAIDIQQEPLSVLMSRAAQQKVFNIEPIRADLEKEKGSTLRDDYLDFVFIPNILFQSENKGGIIKEGHRVLKTGGKLVIIEWRPGAAFGPKNDRIPPLELKEIAQRLGLKLEQEFEAGFYHYCLIFEK